MCFCFQAIETATDRLTQKLSFAAFVAHELLLPVPKDEIHDLLIKHEDAHFMSIQLNLLNTFVYMVHALSFLLSLSLSHTHTAAKKNYEQPHCLKCLLMP
jgi:hypothetical protein